jgi:hypothetical protein
MFEVLGTVLSYKESVFKAETGQSYPYGTAQIRVKDPDGNADIFTFTCDVGGKLDEVIDEEVNLLVYFKKGNNNSPKPRIAGRVSE